MFCALAAGLRQEEATVAAYLRESWSNGLVDGHLKRLESIRRQTDGRAGFQLMRACVRLVS
jgi:transposase